jgi:hypothetical protein
VKLLLVAAALVALVGGSACDAKNPLAPGLPPIISLFVAEPPTLKAGTTTTLRWDVSDGQAEVRVDPGVGNVPTNGNVVVAPLVTTTYTLNARNAGGSVQRIVVVLVTP